MPSNLMHCKINPPLFQVLFLLHKHNPRTF